MYLKRVSKGKYSYLYLAEELMLKGKRKEVIVERLGREDKLTPEQVSNIKERCKGKPFAEVVKIYDAINEEFKRSQASDNNEESNNNNKLSEGLALHYGHLVVRRLCDHYFNLPYKLDYLQKTRTTVRVFNLSKTATFLMATKMMYPSSYLNAYDRINTFLASSLDGLSLDSFYRSLEMLSDFKDELLSYIGNYLRSICKLDKPKLLFFDCTNFYFEAPYDSREEFVMEFHNRTVSRLIGEGKSNNEIREYVNSDEYQFDLKNAVEQAESAGLFLRMRGPSKECRFAQPIAGLSLVVDENGIPLDFEVYPANHSEYGYLPKAVEAIKAKYNLTEAYFVADRGLNSAANLKFIEDNNMGFIVAQKVSNLKEEYLNKMLSSEGWIDVDFSNDQWAAQICEDVDGSDYCYKSCDYIKTSTVTSTNDQGKQVRTKISLECKIIFTFSSKRRRRDLHAIENMIAKARDAINEGRFVSNPNGTGWRAIVNTAKEQAETKDDKEKYRAVSLKEEKIEHLRKLAGYAALVYSPPKGYVESTEKHELYAQKGYKQLVSIEECFRSAKSFIKLRPVFVKRTDHTVGHCVLCVLALTLAKVIQYNLRLQGITVSVNKIQQALDSLTVIAAPVPGRASEIYTSGTFSPSDTAAERREQYEKCLDAPGTQHDNKSLSDRLLALAGLNKLSVFDTPQTLRAKLKIGVRAKLLTEKQKQQLDKVLANLEG